MPRGEAHDPTTTPEEPATTPEPDPTDREDFAHPDPPEKEVKPPEPAPEPAPLTPRHARHLGYLVDDAYLRRSVTKIWKNIPVYHLLDNLGRLKTDDEEAVRWRNTRLLVTSHLAVGVAVWNRPDIFADYTAGQAVNFGVNLFQNETALHDFYHRHDPAIFAKHFERVGVNFTARTFYHPDEMAPGTTFLRFDPTAYYETGLLTLWTKKTTGLRVLVKELAEPDELLDELVVSYD